VCASLTSCLVFGTMTAANGEQQPVSETWNGVAWAVDTLPGFTTTSGFSCGSVELCLTLGSLRGGQTMMGWNGSSWTPLAAQPPPTADATYGCAPAGPCLLAGLAAHGDIAEFWDGSAWAQTPLDPPATATANSVSCDAAAATCAIAGNIVVSAVASPWLATWNGANWTNATMPGSGGFAAVSCPTNDFCLATGWTFPPPTSNPTGPSGNLPTAAMMNSNVWTAIPAPAFLPTGLSCATASSCDAVATTTNEVDVWNGQTWAAEPAAPGTQGLMSVRCDSQGACTAVGAMTDGTAVLERTS
jgi:hypothetical protein